MDIRALAEPLALNPLNAGDLLKTFGLFGVLVIMFAETGLLVGFFFPGDSLLFLAGIASSPIANAIFGSNVQISYPALLIGAPLCAILGAQLGHLLGARYGKRMFDRPDSKLFKREYVEKAEHYFLKFGPAKAVLLARFIPIVRTFLNPVAGTLGMPARTFLLWNVIGGVIWTDGVLIIGHALAKQIYDAIGDKIDNYILPVVFVIVVISLLPVFIEILRERRAKKNGTTPDGAAALGVVAAASVAGLADAAHDEYEALRHHDDGRSSAGQGGGRGAAGQGGQPQGRTYGTPQGSPEGGYPQGSQGPQGGGQSGYPQRGGFPQDGDAQQGGFLDGDGRTPPRSHRR